MCVTWRFSGLLEDLPEAIEGMKSHHWVNDPNAAYVVKRDGTD